MSKRKPNCLVDVSASSSSRSLSVHVLLCYSAFREVCFPPGIGLCGFPITAAAANVAQTQWWGSHFFPATALPNSSLFPTCHRLFFKWQLTCHFFGSQSLLPFIVEMGGETLISTVKSTQDLLFNQKLGIQRMG